MADEAAQPTPTAPEQAEPAKEDAPPGQPAEEASPPEDKKPKKKSKLKSFCHFVYNKQDGFMGRKGLSWAKIGAFFLVLYFLFIAFFFFLLFAFFQSIHDHRPRLTGKHSLLENSPGLGFSPLPDKKLNPDSALVWYSMQDENSWKFYTDQLKKIADLEKNETLKENYNYINCANEAEVEEAEKAEENDPDNTKPHRCSPYLKAGDWGPCNSDANFGYNEGTPCILIRLNRIIDWEPKTTHIDDMKPDNRERIKSLSVEQMAGDNAYQNYVLIDCQGQNPIDKMMLGTYTLYPKGGGSTSGNTTAVNATTTANATTTDTATTTSTVALGIPNKFFPYTGQKGYLSPFIMMHLENPIVGAVIQIRCTADNNGVTKDEKDGLGTVHLEVLIEQ